MNLFVVDRLRRLEQFEGEDTDELLRVIQSSFGIEFTSEDLVQAETVGELSTCIRKKRKSPAPEQCLSAVVFYRLRRAFLGLSDALRPVIVPDKALFELMLWTDRRRQWREIQERSGLDLPQLNMPSWVFGLLLVMSIASCAFVGRHSSVSGIGLVAFGLFAFIVFAYVLKPLYRAFPRGCETLGDLVKLALTRNYKVIAADHGAGSEREVFQALRHLISAEVALDVSKVTAATRFPEDLNIY